LEDPVGWFNMKHKCHLYGCYFDRASPCAQHYEVKREWRPTLIHLFQPAYAYFSPYRRKTNPDSGIQVLVLRERITAVRFLHSFFPAWGTIYNITRSILRSRFSVLTVILISHFSTLNSQNSRSSTLNSPASNHSFSFSANPFKSSNLTFLNACRLVPSRLTWGTMDRG
jgi:hypothetical protein